MSRERAREDVVVLRSPSSRVADTRERGRCGTRTCGRNTNNYRRMSRLSPSRAIITSAPPQSVSRSVRSRAFMLS